MFYVIIFGCVFKTSILAIISRFLIKVKDYFGAVLDKWDLGGWMWEGGVCCVGFGFCCGKVGFCCVCSECCCVGSECCCVRCVL